MTERDEAASSLPPPLQPPDTTSPRHRGRWILLAIVLLFVGGEIALRVAARANSQFCIRMGALKTWDPNRVVRLKANYRFGQVSTNSRGILGPAFDVEKPPGVVRIVVLGDSCSFIPPERNYPRVLEEILRDRMPNVSLEVINASCPGYHSGQARKWYEDEIDGYAHDILIVYIGWNDIGYFNPDGEPYEGSRLVEAAAPNAIQRILSQCYWLRLVGVWRTLRTQGSLVSFERLNPRETGRYYARDYVDHYEKNVGAVIERAKAKGRKVYLLNRATLVTASPTEDEQRRMHFPVGMGRRLFKFLAAIDVYDRALRRIADAHDVEIIDIKSLFKNVEDRRVFTDASHFDARGAERIAARVAGVVAEHIEESTQPAH